MSDIIKNNIKKNPKTVKRTYPWFAEKKYTTNIKKLLLPILSDIQLMLDITKWAKEDSYLTKTEIDENLYVDHNQIFLTFAIGWQEFISDIFVNHLNHKNGLCPPLNEDEGYIECPICTHRQPCSTCNNTGMVYDGFSDDLLQLNKEAKEKINELLGNGDIERSQVWNALFEVSLDVFEFNQKQFNKQIKGGIGFDFETDQSWWFGVQQKWLIENTELVGNLASRTVSRISEALSRGIRRGNAKAEIMEEVKKITQQEITGRFDKKQNRHIKSRLEMLAQDQIGKLNGQVQKEQMLEVGLFYYLWDTQKDERVRGRPYGMYPNVTPSHWAMQDIVCDWRNDRIYYEKEKGDLVKKDRLYEMPFAIPGEETGCRCTASIYWAGLEHAINKNT